MTEALEEQSGEDIILGIYDNVHEELTVKTKLFKKEEEKVCAAYPANMRRPSRHKTWINVGLTLVQHW